MSVSDCSSHWGIDRKMGTGMHRRRGGFCPILLTLPETFSRLLGQMIPLWRLMKRARDLVG
jgi:hypothetical protein